MIDHDRDFVLWTFVRILNRGLYGIVDQPHTGAPIDDGDDGNDDDFVVAKIYI